MISICIIGKDEEAVLDKCLKALVPYGYEIIFVDTGSSDRTKQIAKTYTNFVYDFDWADDFSAARNFAISKANFDYVLNVDCDEIVVQLDKAALERSIRENPDGVGRLHIVNDFSRKKSQNEDERFKSDSWISRLFSKQQFHYEGRIHEQVTSVEGTRFSCYDLPVLVLHSGYDGSEEAIQKKAERNRKLLLQELKEHPDHPYILFQLGQSYYMQHEYEKALIYYDKMLSIDVDPRLEYVGSGVEAYGYCLIETKQYEKALGLEGVYDTFAKTSDFVFLMGLIYMHNGMLSEAVEQFLKATEINIEKVHGTGGFRAYYNIGVIYECVGMLQEASEFYEKAGAYKPAKSRLLAIKKGSAE